MGVLPRRGARHRDASQGRPPPPEPPRLQPPAGAQAMAGHRQPRPDGRAPTPLHPRALPQVRPDHAAPVRVLPRGRGLLRRHGQVLPQDPRRGVHGPAQDGRRQVHHLQLPRHHVVPLRRLLAAGPEDVPHGALQRQAARVVRVHPRRRGARAAARPARRGLGIRRRRARHAQGLPLHGEPERDHPHGAREEVPGQGGGGGVAGDHAGGVQVDAGRAVPAQRGAQHRRLHPVARLDGPAGVHQEDEEAQQDVRRVPGARRGGAQPAAAGRGEELRRQGHGRRLAADRRRPDAGGRARQGKRQGFYSGPHRRRHGELGGHRGVGHLGAPQEARGVRQGHRGAGPRHRPGPLGNREGHPATPLRGRHRQGDDAAAPGGAAAGAPPGARGHHRGRIRHPRRHARARQRVDHRPRPGAVGRARGVHAGAIPRQQARREGAGLRAAAVRIRAADVPRVQPWPEGHPGEPRQPAARVRVEPPKWHDQGGAEHGGDLRPVHAAQVPARGRRRAQAAGAPLHRGCLIHACVRVVSSVYRSSFPVAAQSVPT